MKRVVAAAVVVATIVIAGVLALHTSEPVAPAGARVDALLRQCDAAGSSLAPMYHAMIDPARKLATTDRARVLAIVKGQVANVIDGRIAVCERALAIAQHEKRGSAVSAIGPFLDRLRLAHAALGQLIAELQTGSGAGVPEKLAALDATMK